MAGSWGWLMMLWILFWLLIVGGIVWLVVWLAKRSRMIQPMENPLDALNKRYARGEINKDEYDRIKQDILQGGT
jgi:putative membrane protein